MKKRNLAIGVAAGVAAASVVGASLIIYKKLSKKKKTIDKLDSGTITKVISMNYPTYESLEEVVKESKIAIKGEIVDKFVKEIQVGAYGNGEAISHLYTVSKVKVLKSLKGSLNEEEMVYVKQLGDGSRVIANNFDSEDYFKIGEQYYMFLDSNEKDSEVMPYSCLNPQQGALKIEDNKIIGIDIHTLKRKFYNEVSAEEFEEEVKKYV
ncbi:MAG: hypothetical protein GX895_02970 [Clostridiales bacterium]|uniref:hypothetical protein n=1 Tax=Clostridium sp. N3C TaxID=1776758 RepID=UPI0009457FC7|nr:hypothetical protein [Clostridium sp. N3C]NLZ47744.1 hypothetical protein [Clostridiales bacterium]